MVITKFIAMEPIRQGDTLIFNFEIGKAKAVRQATQADLRFDAVALEDAQAQMPVEVLTSQENIMRAFLSKYESK
jgi:hypothetical protein